MKSHANGPLSELAAHILADMGARCAVDDVSVKRDLIEIKSRLKHEGVSFLTITLPNFCQDFERSLDMGRVTSGAFQGFGKHQCLPAFLQGFTRLVFEPDTGLILDEPSIDAILGIRQLCLFAKKVSMPCSSERNYKAIESYIKIEQDLEQHQDDENVLGIFRSVSSHLWPEVFRNVSDVFYSLLPKHGPGATCERKSGNQKYVHKVWYERLQQYFPVDLHMFSSTNHMLDSTDGIDAITFIPEEEELPVRVTLVPKTLKTPRIIAIEPVCMQYTQQALFRYMLSMLQNNWLTGGHVNFTDQSINQSLAMSSSKKRDLATLDMSSASDRVSMKHVQAMLESVPELLGALTATRSRRAQLPSGEIISLKKFASMGSATCFPVESMYFLTGILTALQIKHGGPVTLKSIKTDIESVYVYGDDLIIPIDAAEVVVEVLHTLGCKVNTSKSFWTGQFRESCGCDAYDGWRITPTYVRHLPPTHKRNACAIISWVETSNLFYRSGFWQTANYMKNVVESVIGLQPIVSDDSAALGFVSFQRYRSVHGWDKRYQSLFVKGWCATPVRASDTIDGYDALFKCLLILERSRDRSPLEPICIEKDHLTHSARHGASRIKRRRILVS